MEHAFMKKKLERHLTAISTEAMAAIDIISEAGISEMAARGIPMRSEADFDFNVVGLYAADRLEMEPAVLLKDYERLMLLEGLVGYTDEEEAQG